MTVRSATFRWPPAPRRPAAPDPRTLGARLAEDARDRCRPAAELVARASAAAWAWVRERPEAWSFEEAAGELEAGLAGWSAAHGWRGPAALWIDALRGAFRAARGLDLPGPREALLEELAQWTAGSDETGELDPEGPWDGRPLGAGRRLPRRGEAARRAAEALAPRERVLVPGDSETVALALVEARRRGLEPLACVPVGGPDRSGLRMARRLSEVGVRVSVRPDLAWPQELAAADRIWLGTEAIGAGAFVAAAGLARVLEEARRHELPVEGLATGDKLVPGGRVLLPARPEEDAWLLWSEAPAGVELDAPLLELAPLEHVDGWWTERGRERAGELCLRALRPRAEAPLDADAPAR